MSRRFHSESRARKRLAAFLLLLWSALTGSLAILAAPKDDPLTDKSRGAGEIIIKTLQCLNASCDSAAALSAIDARRLGITLWNNRAKRGRIAPESGYRAPNTAVFRPFSFDHIAFSPVRSMRLVYDVDRRTFWPLASSRYIRRESAGRYALLLPRRASTRLLRIEGVAAAELNAKIFAVPRFAGIYWELFGLTRTPGRQVRWNNQDYLAFKGLKAGRKYALLLEDPANVFSDSGDDMLKGIVWSGPYAVAVAKVRPSSNRK